uniref:Uncharacterized protein n=1 Tax=Sus scrofa TaxID=9823 RepID=A0A4X1TJF9_PIG
MALLYWDKNKGSFSLEVLDSAGGCARPHPGSGRLYSLGRPFLCPCQACSWGAFQPAVQCGSRASWHPNI